MTAPCIRNGKGTTLLIGIDRNFSDVESDDYSESARSYELGKASDFACARPRPDFSAFLCLWRKVTIGWEMRPVRLVLQNIRNFFSQNGWCLPFTKNSRSCKGSNKAESAGAKGQRKAWRAAFHDLYGCPPTFTAVVKKVVVVFYFSAFGGI